VTYSAYLPSREDILKPWPPAKAFDQGEPKAHYWVKHGVVFHGEDVVQGADSTSLRCWMSGYAADERRVYLNGRHDRTLDARTFLCHSLAFHGDEAAIRTPYGGRIKDADVASFEALDAGYEPIPGGKATFLLLYTGYARDRTRVYWCDNGGKGMHVAKADPQSFQALFFNFGMDERHVFCGRAVIPKANPETWRRIAGPYSTDGQRVYYFNRPVQGADVDSFQAYPTLTGNFVCARDRFRCYVHDEVADEARFQEWMR
jgi:hypothetical protein